MFDLAAKRGPLREGGLSSTFEVEVAPEAQDSGEVFAYAAPHEELALAPIAFLDVIGIVVVDADLVDAEEVLVDLLSGVEEGEVAVKLTVAVLSYVEFGDLHARGLGVDVVEREVGVGLEKADVRRSAILLEVLQRPPEKAYGTISFFCGTRWHSAVTFFKTVKNGLQV